jgi:hypothetical protein
MLVGFLENIYLSQPTWSINTMINI